jgi:hypothetical protein
MSTPVPGLVIVREEGPRESYRVVHAASGFFLVRDCPGPGSAEDAALDLADLLDWTMTAPRILTLLEAFPEICGEVERIAGRWGGTSYGGALTARFPEPVSA